ncbi:MAG: ABC transporter permease, partial [Deltaproteobacteria bacterium]
MINIPSTIRISLNALGTNKMRSGLTMLGIIIGVGAVITMLAVGTGARQKIGEQISSMGSNLLIVLPGATSSGGVRMGAGTQATLSSSDVEAILRESPAVSFAAPMHGGVAQAVYGSQNWSTAVSGTTSAMLEIKDWPIASGRPFTEEDIRNSTKVALLGQTVV